jgi:alpha-D-ribose 1-methylphosphonate 5-phosphate C-P lyase
LGLDFEDHPFRVQTFDRPCALCGADGVYLDEVLLDWSAGQSSIFGLSNFGVGDGSMT